MTNGVNEQICRFHTKALTNPAVRSLHTQFLSRGGTMKTSVLVAIVTLVPGLFLMQASGGSSVAVIDFERIVSEAPGGKDALDKLNAFTSDQRATIAKKQQEADDLANKL